MNYYGFDVLVREREDGGWISWTPQQPGLSSWGVHESEAVNGIQRSIDEYLKMKGESEFEHPTKR